MQTIVREPIELIDADLDQVAGGGVSQSNSSSIEQIAVQIGGDDNTINQEAEVTQINAFKARVRVRSEG
jgi:hypothetical protein